MTIWSGLCRGQSRRHSLWPGAPSACHVLCRGGSPRRMVLAGAPPRATWPSTPRVRPSASCTLPLMAIARRHAAPRASTPRVTCHRRRRRRTRARSCLPREVDAEGQARLRRGQPTVGISAVSCSEHQIVPTQKMDSEKLLFIF
jgi:hypothetical protein